MKYLTEAKRIELRKLLEKQAQTYADLNTATGLSYEILGRYIRELRALKVVHVTGYVESEQQGRPVTQFAWGDKPDVVRPAPLTSAQRMQRTRAARKESK